jgi:hypothetical protein
MPKRPHRLAVNAFSRARLRVLVPLAFGVSSQAASASCASGNAWVDAALGAKRLPLQEVGGVKILHVGSS